MATPTGNERSDEYISTRSTNTANTLALPEKGEPTTPKIEDREQASRLNDDLELIRAERAISTQDADVAKQRSRHTGVGVEDAFNEHHHDDPQQNDKDNNAALYRLWMWLKKFPRFFRYFLYAMPGAAIVLAPVLLGYFDVGGDLVKTALGGRYGPTLFWFGIWLEIVWCSLWATRMITSIMPYLFKGMARMFGSTNARKWHDIGRQMELHTSMFLWLLAMLISFVPIMNSHRATYNNDGEPVDLRWIDIVNKVIIAFFVLATLNLAEKVTLQWIAAAFHQRTYATRIANHKMDIQHLVALYGYAVTRLEREDMSWPQNAGSGARTPMQTIQNTARTAFNKVGSVAGRIGNDFVGRRSVNSNHPTKMVGELLRSTPSAHTLARLIYRSLIGEGKDTVFLQDMQAVFGDDTEKAETVFSMFDKDLNNDISMEEFEAVCNETHLEQKAIAASLKDLDSVIKKLDKVFFVVICVVTVIVFVSIISASAAAGLASASTTALALSWMLQATAQEFLQSVIFVFVKHPFDVGDRVTVYGNTGASLKGDDYYVTEISLLYTEFKKMEGHIVQAPNSLLNTLFILNQRRSNGLADPVTLRMRFGTPAYMIEELKARMLAFCLLNKRDYQPRIITEVCTIEDVRCTTVNFIFFHKSNFQNELLRLTRHNKFLAELQLQMVEVGIQGPFHADPGGNRNTPYWMLSLPPPAGIQVPPPYENSPFLSAAVQEADAKRAQQTPPPPPPQDVPVTGQAVPSAAAHAAVASGVPLGSTTTMGYRARADSRAAGMTSVIHPIVEDTFSDFQDVFESRKGVGRYASVREQRGPLSRSESRASNDVGSSTGIQRIGSNDTTGGPGGRRLFGGRPGSKSHVTDSSEIV